MLFYFLKEFGRYEVPDKESEVTSSSVPPWEIVRSSSPNLANINQIKLYTHKQHPNSAYRMPST